MAFGGSILLLATATAVELTVPVYQYSLRARLRGFLHSLLYIGFGGLFVMVAQSACLSIGLSPVVLLPLSGWAGDAAALAVVLIVTDFLAYWHHRALHRFAWPIHAVHHSQTELHAANSYGHLAEKITQFLIIAVPLSLVSFEAPAVPFLVVAIKQLLEYYIHSPVSVNLGHLRVVLVDNRFHRIHHSVETRHFDRNFGILLSVWDRLFGTAHEPVANDWPDTGIAGHPPPASVTEYLLFPLRFCGQNGYSRSKD